MDPVTVGRIRDLQTLNLEREIIGELKITEEDNLLVVFHSTNKTIRVFPCSENFAYKIIIIMKKVLPDFIGKLGGVFMRLNIQPLFTSALCFQEDVCSYEAYFDPKGLQNRLDLLTRDILEIHGVEDVRIHTISRE